VSLVTHPERERIEFRDALKATEKQTRISLAKLESLKPKITARYESYQAQARAQESRRPASANERGNGHSRRMSSLDSMLARITSDPGVAGAARPIAAAENGALAVKLAQKELMRRETARRATRQAGISEAEEQARRSGGVWGGWEQALTADEWAPNGATSAIARRRESQEDEEAVADLRRRMQETRRKIEGVRSDAIQGYGNRGNGAQRSSEGPPTQQPSSGFSYPMVPKRSNSDVWVPSPRVLPKHIEPPPPYPQASPGSLTETPPEVPPKEGLQIDGAHQDTWLFTNDKDVPPRPEKAFPVPLSAANISPPRSATATPIPSSDLNPSTFTFKPSAYLENGAPLRTVFLPPDLRHEFLKIAAPNTRKNLETCGILCGTLISNALFISRLIIPDQESTSDTCDTINESALFDYCDSEDLMVLGWIHTHPTQTCFMSSRDLHTHCGYQVMMPESIAIVCAPSKDPS
jgi:STAM-binding protein